MSDKWRGCQYALTGYAVPQVRMQAYLQSYYPHQTGLKQADVLGCSTRALGTSARLLSIFILQVGTCSGAPAEWSAKGC